MARTWRSDDSDKWLEGFGDGSDGAYAPSTSTEAPIDSSCSGTSGSKSLTATNASFASGQIILIHQSRGTGEGNWELNKIASYSAGTITTKYSLMNTYTDSGASQAQVRVLKQYSSVLIDTGVTLTSKSWGGNVGGIIGWFCNGTTTITGNVVAKGSNASSGTGGTTGGFNGGNGATGTSDGGWQGEGTSGAGADTNAAANGNGGGSGTGTVNQGGGGGGGNGAAGSNGSIGGTGGLERGGASLVDMVFGGGGGGGGNFDGTPPAGGGGGGGGIVFIASSTVTISGTIQLSGGNGANGGGGASGGGGGGAGGSCLIKAQTATLGTTKITSSGGSGGSSNGSNEGGNGAVGRVHLDYSGSYSGTTTPTIDTSFDSFITPYLQTKGDIQGFFLC